MAYIEFTIMGKPRGKDRGRIVTVRGRSTIADTKENRAAEKAIREACRAAMAVEPWHGVPLTGPVKFECVAVFAIPPSWPKWKREAAARGEIHHTAKPDASNIVKLFEDAVNPPGNPPEGAAVWPPHGHGYAYGDDSQITDTRCLKRYGFPERTVVRITPLNTKGQAYD